MRKTAVLLWAVVAITGCDKLETTLGNGPVGRYQMVASVGANTFIIDTKSGSVWRFSGYKFWPVTVETTGKSPEEKLAQLKALRAELAVEKQKRGLPPSPEELQALKELTAND